MYCSAAVADPRADWPCHGLYAPAAASTAGSLRTGKLTARDEAQRADLIVQGFGQHRSVVP